VPAVALSRAGARVVESGPGGEDLTAGAWQRLEALPDPRSPQGRIYLWVPITSSTSCDQVIFIDHASDVSLFSDAVLVEVDRLG